VTKVGFLLATMREAFQETAGGPLILILQEDEYDGA
jgi:hypothetical protein